MAITIPTVITHNGSEQTYIVPASVEKITFKADGATTTITTTTDTHTTAYFFLDDTQEITIENRNLPSTTFYLKSASGKTCILYETGLRT